MLFADPAKTAREVVVRTRPDEAVTPLASREEAFNNRGEDIKVAVVGASSTTGLMVTDMLVSR